MYSLDPKLKTPLHIQLYEALKKDIQENYQVKEKLDSIRKVCNTYSLSKNTVENAYSQLVAEGYIESKNRSGFYVCENQYEISKEKHTEHIEKEKENYLYDFAPAALNKEDFPLKLWKRVFNRVINEDLELGIYPEGQGELGLRSEISKYLYRSRGVNSHPSQIVVTSGFGEAMALVAKILKNEHSYFAMEDPGYYVANSVFQDYGYEIEKIPLDENGILLNELQKIQSKIVYITPSHQYPTGVTIPIANRVEILKWANENSAFIIEDDYDSELTYKNRPIPSLQGLDTNDKVIYMGTFAKALSPALRVSFAVLPQPLLKKYQTLYDSKFPKVSLIIQKVLEIFLKEGHWEKHLRKIRTKNRKKHDLMKNLLMHRLGDSIKIESSGAGLSILINPTVPFNYEKLKLLAEEKRIKIYFTKEFCGGKWDAIRMGFGKFKEEELENAIEIFTEIWKKSIK